MGVGKHGGNGEMATGNTILRVRTGSGMHGIATGNSDRDEMGICIEDPAYVIGLLGFEQHGYRDAAERTGRFDAPSQPGDLDLTVYSLRKYTRLALNGNPSIIEVLYSHDNDIVSIDRHGHALRELRASIVSQEAGPKYLGYLHAQRRSMQSRDGKGRDVTRPELVELHGYDTKYAGHMIRLGMQGIELLSAGTITLPMREHEASLIRDIRHGLYEMEWVLHYAETLEQSIKHLMDNPAGKLAAHPDRDTVNAWLVETYQAHWGYHNGPPACWDY